MRAMLHGRAHVEHHDGTRNSWTARQIFQEWQIPPSSIELMVCRLRWWQSIAGNPEHHRHYLSIFFGEYPFEQRTREAGNEAAD
eukprot:9487301-Pyramimonas_sp.AAC.1